MKHLFLLLSLWLWHGFAVGQSLYGYYQGKRVAYRTVGDQLVVRLREGAKVGAAQLASDARVRLTSKIAPQLGTMFLTIDTAKVADVSGFAREMQQRMPDFLSVSPVLAMSDDKNQSAPGGAWLDEVIVKPSAKIPLARLLAKAKELGLAQQRYHLHDSTTLIFRTIQPAPLNVLEAANRLQESGLVDFAEPNWLLFLKPNQAAWPNDLRLGEAWHLRNTGQGQGLADADIDADEAWAMTTGCPGIRIAVVGNGVQRNHPDLAPNMLDGFDALGNNNNGNADILRGIRRGHETLVAGVAAARGNNGVGAAGVAYNCRIVPVRFYIGDGEFAPITQTSELLTASINWIWQQDRADVIVMSFGEAGLFTTNLNVAIINATTLGRPRPGGRAGCVVVGGAGSSGENFIAYPASLPQVLAVGGTNNRDQYSSQANWGPQLSVVAPAEDIFGTDLTGNAGYGNSDYTSQTGTSFATPQVAGIAALLLSVNPNLTQQQVRDIIEQTCDKPSPGIGLGSYEITPGYPNGTWNPRMGYGRVNAAAALRRVVGNIVGPARVCLASGASNYTLAGSTLPAGFTWSASPNLQVTGSGNSATVTQAGAEGPGWLQATWPSPCGGDPIRLRFDIQVGPIPPIVVRGHNPGMQICPGGSYGFEVSPQPFDYSVSVIAGLATASYSPFFQLLIVSSNDIGQSLVRLTATDPSNPGCPRSIDLLFDCQDCGNPCVRTAVTYPNPTSGQVRVLFEPVKPNSIGPCRVISLALYNRSQQAVRQIVVE
ncbi:MAG: S8 family serine peptidase [Bernardetiaceae bacterium]|nr:S8 family serine peptidase [Bernardetiaceae bacterium]